MTTNDALTQSAASVHNSEQEANVNRKITILYERLSRDDPDAIGESNSIKTQRAMLEEYANRHGFVPFEHISDDAWVKTLNKNFMKKFAQLLSNKKAQ
jgi:hypothetical protein